MQLLRASRELFARQPDERFESLQALWTYCQGKKERSVDRWHPPQGIGTVGNGHLQLKLEDASFTMNDWSFSQLCRLAGVAKDTVNRLNPATAEKVFAETLPREGNKPLQVLTDDRGVRSIHGTAYTRLWDADLVSMISEFAVDFGPAQRGINGATGLYAGEQDMFAFLIDPTGWCEIGGEAFAPGFFVWNSEVGRRSLGVETFFFQKICGNHIVWDATEVVSWKRKHTASVSSGLPEIRQRIANLVEKRDARRDGFVRTIRAAMESRLGDAEEATKLLNKHGITRKLGKQAVEIASQKGALTVWSLVDALTQLSRDLDAGDRTEADQKSSLILSAVA